MILHERKCPCIKFISFFFSMPLTGQPFQSLPFSLEGIFFLTLASCDISHCLLLEINIFLVQTFKQKTAYEIPGSDWSSDVCSSDLTREVACLTKKWNEFNAWTFSFMQNHALHNIRILHEVCVFCSFETGMLGLAPDKSFRKTFGEKEDNSKRSELLKYSSQLSQNSVNWQPSISPGEDEKASDQR